MTAQTQPTFACASCGKQYVWEASLAGQVLQCPCGAELTIPSQNPQLNAVTPIALAYARPMPRQSASGSIRTPAMQARSSSLILGYIWLILGTLILVVGTASSLNGTGQVNVVAQILLTIGYMLVFLIPGASYLVGASGIRNGRKWGAIVGTVAAIWSTAALGLILIGVLVGFIYGRGDRVEFFVQGIFLGCFLAANVIMIKSFALAKNELA